jgi:hypothetical protein
MIYAIVKVVNVYAIMDTLDINVINVSKVIFHFQIVKNANAMVLAIIVLQMVYVLIALLIQMDLIAKDAKLVILVILY